MIPGDTVENTGTSCPILECPAMKKLSTGFGLCLFWLFVGAASAAAQ
jgi:hypothetical protein